MFLGVIRAVCCRDSRSSFFTSALFKAANLSSNFAKPPFLKRPIVKLGEFKNFCSSHYSAIFHSRKMSTEKSEGAYGTWNSPITSNRLTENTRKFEEVRLDPTERGKGIVYWSEGRPSEAGRTVICSRFTGGKMLEWTPEGFSARNKVHEYGGGSFFVYNGVVYFSNFADQRIYKQEAFNKEPVPVTEVNEFYRYADGCFYNGYIYCIREDHSNPNSLPINTIVSIHAEKGTQNVIVEGADFYASPKISPDGMNIIWMQWNSPNMPWDDTEIWIANLTDNGAVQAGSERKVAGNPGSNFMQPRFSPHGKPYYISDESDWWNLYEFNDTGVHHNVNSLNKELGGPHWIFGGDAFSFDPNNTGDVAVAFDFELGIVNLKSELYYKQETGYTSHRFINFGRDSCIYCVAASPTKFNAVIRWNVITGETEVIQESRDSIDESLISVPEHISFPTGVDHQDTAYGYFYAPKNPYYKGPAKTLPPLVVIVHGGPTAQASSALDLRKQYLTTRGLAVLDVNYRGSTGYGKKYRQQLYGQWGISDVDDCCAGASHLAKEQLVDPYRLAITGGSAGGYTVLACLTFRNVFKVGCSLYGIGDLEALEKDTHKFEASYNSKLIGPYPDDAEEYRKRSPINSADRLNCPVVFFQGADDKVVLPQQAESMYKVLLDKGLPTALVIFPGEGHGFRKSENIQLSIDGEFYFFCKIFGIPLKEFENKIDIKNFDPSLSHKSV